MMRIALLITAAWGLWAMPVLCESGMLEDCCGQTCPDGEDSGCECPGCVELCNAHATKPDGASEACVTKAGMLLAVLPAHADTTVSSDQITFDEPAWLLSLRANLPYPESDRPLLL